MLKTLKNTDYIILILPLVLVAIGVVAIFSAGYNDNIQNEYIKQLIWVGIGIVAMLFFWMFDINMQGVFSYVFFPIFILLLVGVLFTTPINNVNSWYRFGQVNLQPSELMKIVYILFVARIMQTMLKKKTLNKWYNILLILGIFVLVVSLIIIQPDFGTAMVFASITFFMLFKAGIKYRYVLIAVLIVLLALPMIYFFVLSDYQQARIQVFFNPEMDPLGSGYNAIQSKIAIGSGMLFGTGVLNGTQTQFGYLPVKSSDFIFSVISEEMGFVGSMVIVVIYVFFFIKILRLSMKTGDVFSSIVLTGIFGMFFFHFVENIGMTMGLLPITGIPLPFVSYGGTNLLTSFIALGIILNISARKNKEIFVRSEKINEK